MKARSYPWMMREIATPKPAAFWQSVRLVFAMLVWKTRR